MSIKDIFRIAPEEEVLWISEYEVMESAAGYYIGRAYYDVDYYAWMPYSRDSEYFTTKKAAEAYFEYGGFNV